MPTDREPEPRLLGAKHRTSLPDWPIVTAWPRQVEAPDRDFFQVLGQRRSRMGGDVPESKLAALLRHSTQLRERRRDGRFGQWESRTAPSAGGLHALRLLVIGAGLTVGGLYDSEAHALRAPMDLSEAWELNRRSVHELTGVDNGATIQFVADGRLYADCYDGWETLMWRDAGAMSAVLSLIATALSINAVVLGRRGDAIVNAAGLTGDWIAAGALQLSS